MDAATSHVHVRVQASPGHGGHSQHVPEPHELQHRFLEREWLDHGLVVIAHDLVVITEVAQVHLQLSPPAFSCFGPEGVPLGKGWQPQLGTVCLLLQQAVELMELAVSLVEDSLGTVVGEGGPDVEDEMVLDPQVLEHLHIDEQSIAGAPGLAVGVVGGEGVGHMGRDVEE